MLFRSRIEEEKVTVSKMIALYCKKKHRQKKLCSSCQALHDYAMQRLDRCVFGNEKTVCAKCLVHCYKPDRREEIREVMIFAGPQMLLYHPWLALLHTYRSFTSK
jgi:hypothetical protein